MGKRTVATWIIAALVVGVVLGSFGIASAATSTATSATAGARLRLGVSMQQAKTTLADIVAKLTGKSVTDVRAERATGKSLAAIAAEDGVSADKVVADTLAGRKTTLASLVKQGKITQAQADAALAQMTTRINERVNSTAACTGAGPGSGACGAGAGAGGACGMGGNGGGRGRMMGGAGAGSGTCTIVTQ